MNESAKRLTNAFSKKVENLAQAVSLHFMCYNLACVYTTLKTTPAVKAGLRITSGDH